MVIIKHSAEDIKRIDIEAHKRNDCKIGVIPSEKFAPQDSDLESNRLGLAGELAVAKYPRQPMPRDTGIAGDGGEHDFIYYGRTVQAKYNRYPFGDLYMKYGTTLKADIAILTTPVTKGTLEEIAIVGWVTKPEFDTLARLIDYGHGPCWAVAQNQLHPIEDLLPVHYKERNSLKIAC